MCTEFKQPAFLIQISQFYTCAHNQKYFSNLYFIAQNQINELNFSMGPMFFDSMFVQSPFSSFGPEQPRRLWATLETMVSTLRKNIEILQSKLFFSFYYFLEKSIKWNQSVSRIILRNLASNKWVKKAT